MKSQCLVILLSLFSLHLFGQADTVAQKKRLDFAKTYFELGGIAMPAFTGKHLSDNDRITAFEHSASLQSYLSWGGFHFWGHAEFYVNFPLSQFNLNQKSEETDFRSTHSVVTGARFLPWAFQEKKIRPYVGLSWSALDFQQRSAADEGSPIYTKDFLLVPGLGLLYAHKRFAFRLGGNYFFNNQWNYALSKTTFTTINTPSFNVHLGLIYAFENSHDKNQETNKRWNDYPRVSKLSTGFTKKGDFYIGLGPSISFSLARSEFNKSNFPYLNQKQSSNSYFDLALGYQFNQANLFAALSFRNPKFETSGYGTHQTIQKTSIAIELNKFLTDYSGFAPYIGLNLAFDHIQYVEEIEQQASRTLRFQQFAPGLTLGWDIVPGKTEEALVLRTNLRWYPWSSFSIDQQTFHFSQLEYNLIQAIFYPGRYFRSKEKKGVAL